MIQITSNKQLKEALKSELPDWNINALPSVKTVTINVGIGQYKDDNEKIAKTIKVLEMIGGQKSVPTKAKKSISAFKTREGQIIGYKITLRNKRAFDLINKLLHVAIPRIRDFRGLDASNINGSSFNFGVKDNIIFPETNYDNVGNVCGFQVTITLNHSNSEKTKKAMEVLGAKFK